MNCATRTGFRTSSRSAGVAVIAIAALVLPAPAKTEFLPDLDTATSEQRTFLMTAFQRLDDGDPANDAPVLAQLDEQLEQLPEPSLVRGMVQMFRAMALQDSDKAEAVAALEESVALLPDYSGPLMIGATVYTYDDQPAKASDYLLRASAIDPHIAARLDEYTLFGLMHRLSARGQRGRMAALSERMLELGWVGERISSRPTLAANAIEARMEAGDREAAAKLIPSLIAPRLARDLLLDNRFEQLWPDIERWAGAKLENIWPLYLRQSRARWHARRNSSSALDYFQALEIANHDSTILWEILPLLSGTIDAENDPDLVFLVAPIARVLARSDRWPEVHALFERASRSWPLGEDAGSLNVAANHARYLHYSGRTAEGVDRIDAALADAVQRGGEVNQDALVAMHETRACMLHDLGRADAAASSIAFVTELGSPTDIATLQLCLDRHDAAVDALIAGLDQPQWRGSILAFVQKPDYPPIAGEVARKERERTDRLRSDVRLMERVSRFGRVLPWALNDGAPPEDARNEKQSETTT